jgi:hypothetical protein
LKRPSNFFGDAGNPGVGLSAGPKPHAWRAADWRGFEMIPAIDSRDYAEMGAKLVAKNLDDRNPKFPQRMPMKGT